MADEKILKDEVLNNEELEKVAGGYYNTWKDFQTIKALEKKATVFSIPNTLNIAPKEFRTLS